jgi:SOS-response transcriptional repressor LexA
MSRLFVVTMMTLLKIVLHFVYKYGIIEPEHVSLAGDNTFAKEGITMAIELLDPMTTQEKEYRVRLLKSGEIVRKRRMEMGLSHEALSEATGMSQGYVSVWENGKRVPSDMVIERVAQKLELDFEELRKLAQKERYIKEYEKMSRKYEAIGTDQMNGKEYLDITTDEDVKLVPIPDGMIQIPILGTVPGGDPIEVDPSTMDSPESSIMLPEVLIVDKEMTFALWVRGNSMAGRVEDGDIVVVQRGAMPESGGIAVVRLHHEVTLKSIEYRDEVILLRGTNPTIKPISVTEGDKDGFEIIGKVIGVYGQNR